MSSSIFEKSEILTPEYKERTLIPSPIWVLIREMLCIEIMALDLVFCLDVFEFVFCLDVFEFVFCLDVFEFVFCLDVFEFVFCLDVFEFVSCLDSCLI